MKHLELPLENKNIQNAINHSAIIAVTDRAGRIIYVNQKFCEISKYSENELLGKTHRIIKSDVHAKEFYESMWKTIASGHVWTGELCNKAKDGSAYWVHTSIVPCPDKENHDLKYIAIRFDITDRKLLEKQLEDTSKNLLNKNNELQVLHQETTDLIHTHKHQVKIAHDMGKSEIAVDILHNVGNVLNSVYTSAELIENTAKKSAINGFHKANEILSGNIENFDKFYLSDSKGKKLLEFYLELDKAVKKDFDILKAESKNMLQKLSVIRNIISSQQTHVKNIPKSEKTLTP